MKQFIDCFFVLMTQKFATCACINSDLVEKMSISGLKSKFCINDVKLQLSIAFSFTGERQMKIKLFDSLSAVTTQSK